MSNKMNLTEEQKQAMRACKTPEEILSYAEENDIELPPDLLEAISGGGESPYTYYDRKYNKCPAHSNGKHDYKFTGESRPTDCWFYDTEEHYVCDCGKGYWSAGAFEWSVKWD